ncbi:MAG: OsmC family protein [Longimicrobiales bacterium]
MADSTVALRWTGEGMQFVGGAPDRPEVLLDGNGRVAPSPVQTLLLALAACTGSDIVEITGKMRVTLASLQVHVEGDRNQDFPRRFNRIRMVFRAGGVAESDRDKVRHAVRLSEEKYCSVLHTLRTDLAFSSEVEFA